MSAEFQLLEVEDRLVERLADEVSTRLQTLASKAAAPAGFNWRRPAPALAPRRRTRLILTTPVPA